MATRYTKVYDYSLLGRVNVEHKRELFLLKCDLGNSNTDEKIALDYILELKERIRELENNQ